MKYSTVNIAFARATPHAVISLAYSGRLSQIVLWNTISEKLTRSSWLKGRVQVLDVSSDGDYFSYFAETFARNIVSICRCGSSALHEGTLLLALFSPAPCYGAIWARSITLGRFATGHRRYLDGVGRVCPA